MRHGVIPGRAKGASPESRATRSEQAALDSGLARFASAPE
jgi:hypothetical protein